MTNMPTDPPRSAARRFPLQATPVDRSAGVAPAASAGIQPAMLLPDKYWSSPITYFQSPLTAALQAGTAHVL